MGHRIRHNVIAGTVTIWACVCIAVLVGCSQIASPAPSNANRAESHSPSRAFSQLDDRTLSPAEEAEIAAAAAPLTYPTGWLIADAAGIPAGAPFQVLRLPDIAVTAHRNGEEVAPDERQRLAGELSEFDDGSAVVSYDGNVTAVDPGLLLVNLPDVMPEAVYDIVYSYASTSNCNGIAIPGVTGEALEGYVAGEQESPYWNGPRFVVPGAYRTALKALAASNELAESGYRLLVYDVYRPMRAQNDLADALQSAYQSNPAIQAGLGGWSIGWYVALGASGHNYGTDFDVGVCDSAGNPLDMPSSFDAFDENGHLTASPVDPSSISPASYRDGVSSNGACLALHAAFVHAGFSELASEWWHFGDEATESANRSIAGNGGLDFVASLS